MIRIAALSVIVLGVSTGGCSAPPKRAVSESQIRAGRRVYQAYGKQKEMRPIERLQTEFTLLQQTRVVCQFDKYEPPQKKAVKDRSEQGVLVNNNTKERVLVGYNENNKTLDKGTYEVWVDAEFIPDVLQEKESAEVHMTVRY